MKTRLDFVTNSSSSSFIFKNNTDETLNGRQFLEKMFSQIFAEAEDRFELRPGESTIIECSDDGEDRFELFVHCVFDSWTPTSWAKDQGVDIEFHESHH